MKKTSMEEAREAALAILRAEVSDHYTFHNEQHTTEMVRSLHRICEGLPLTDKQRELLTIAAWFHDTGYTQGWKDHEERSSAHAAQFMKDRAYDEKDITTVVRIIMATRINDTPSELLEEIISDADLSHLGRACYWEYCKKLRIERALTQACVVSDEYWLDKEIEFLEGHQFYTPTADALYTEQKLRHIDQLYKKRKALNDKSE